jgi:hypothetical protein
MSTTQPYPITASLSKVWKNVQALTMGLNKTSARNRVRENQTLKMAQLEQNQHLSFLKRWCKSTQDKSKWYSSTGHRVLKKPQSAAWNKQCPNSMVFEMKNSANVGRKYSKWNPNCSGQ